MSAARLKVLCVEPLRYADALRDRFAAFADVEYVDVDGQNALVQAVAAARYQALVVRLGLAIDDAVLAAQPMLRFVGTPTTGLDHIDLEACARRDVRVLSLKGETAFLDGIKSTAEHTWALVLALSRHLPAAVADTSAGRWRREPFLADELDGKTLGVLGCGRLGRMVAGYGLAFGMDVLVHDTDAGALARAPQGTRAVDLEELLARSDVLSVHLPLEERTRGFLDAARVARMKRGAWLINTARGELVDEDAVARALESGALGGAAVDVLGDDGRWASTVQGEHALLELQRAGRRVIVTPHVGGYGAVSIEKTRGFLIDKLKDAARAQGIA